MARVPHNVLPMTPPALRLPTTLAFLLLPFFMQSFDQGKIRQCKHLFRETVRSVTAPERLAVSESLGHRPSAERGNGTLCSMSFQLSRGGVGGTVSATR